MAAVYAGCTEDRCSVAIKLLHPRLSFEADFQRRFQREARLANTIKHPGVVPVQDTGVSEDGCWFLVMPLLDGETLRARTHRLGGCLPLEEVVSIGCALLEVLEAAHACGIVHCDIKPENLLLTTEGELKVLDFGIARILASTEAPSVTRTGFRAGTPAFMSPEQAQGRIRDLDCRTDIWSVGATLFALVSGATVYEGDTPEVIMARAATVHPRAVASVAPVLPPEICAVIDRALSFASLERWANAAEMREALSAAYAKAGFETLPPLPKANAVSSLTVVFGLETRIIPEPPPPEVEGPRLTALLPPSSTSSAVPSAATPTKARASRKFITATAGLLLVLGVGRVAPFKVWMAPHGLVESARSAASRDAELAIEAGLQLWRDASSEAAREKFAEAARKDPSLPLPHLLFVAASEWVDPQVRAHFSQAQILRQRMSGAQGALLDALEPLVTEPQDLAATTRRLEAFTSSFPGDSIGWTVRAAHGLRNKEGAAVLAELEHVNGAIALWFRARALLLLDELEAARKALAECASSAPLAVDCLSWRVRLEINEGDCETAAAAAKQLIAIDPASPQGYSLLARAELGRSHHTSAVRAILKDKWARLSNEIIDAERERDEFFLASYDGRFDDAYRALDGWEKAGAKSNATENRAWPAIYRVDLDLELGQHEAARRSARSFVESSQSWLRSDYMDLPVESTRLLYLTGLLSRESFLQRRAVDERNLVLRGGYFSEAGVRWFDAYVQMVREPADAVLALKAQPNGEHVTDAVFRDIGVDYAVGRSYYLAGRIDEALPLLERPTRSCSYYKSTERIRSTLLNGQALAISHREREACDAYRVVVRQWGGERRSSSAREARRMAREIGCDLGDVR